MLRTQHRTETWFVSQPDHAGVAGYLAAHWGSGDFLRPGHYVPASDVESLRAEVIYGIAQHDNGWWEWEATPALSPEDGLPLGFTDVLLSRQEGMDRWRQGIPRLSASHPYASLLISWHAFWLYNPTLEPSTDPAFRHPLFWKEAFPDALEDEVAETKQFVEEIEAIQSELVARLKADPITKQWVEPQQLKPNARLLQLLDAVSLSICSSLIPTSEGESNGRRENVLKLLDVPRGGWNDRATIEVLPMGNRRIRFEPYPFDLDPLTVLVPAKVLQSTDDNERPFPTRWHAEPTSLIRYEFSAR